MNTNEYILPIPDTEQFLRVGSIIQITRFNTTRFIVKFGWYTWGGNRPVCGWYLEREDDPHFIKPLQLPDMYDIYILEQ